MDWSPDRRLQGRMFLALTLTVVGYGVLLSLLFSLLPTALALFTCVALAAVMIGSVYWADYVAYWATGAVAIDREQYPLVYDLTDRLAQQADVPRPPVAVIPADEPNALSAGTGNRTVICVTTGLLQTLEEDELEAVLAHELAHLKNSDSSVMTVAAFPTVVSVVTLSAASRAITPVSFLLGFPFWIATYLLFVGLPVYVASLPGTLVLSRYREYAADRGAVAITGKPFALASALATIHGESTPPDDDLRSVAGFNAFCIVPTSSMLPFTTHPPTHKRIQRLQTTFTKSE
ncbi:M48 family metalloprotease [Natronobacterium gregoryi]|uniref:Heat shock protein HtpX n=2 Tax=Natronobacterium gregoryi TaxID=44930 RepID=L0ALD8_NATGS|nr:M48 family metalloprotease [Natronobacterium gregoryi]AFZ73870.1 Zn-dependent protease with chaperone function [Natronobacterium gregoryi SP2]ELY65030.1 heat shock protein HtpX [Natronobacterium gregoryi SP2]PLK18407.1 peptidase M48 [Natronobacterium gregoryi SP2]SFJ71231.1 heat shock protein HtpX [Natronobacterium gregoryi]